jgi:hypothetical protein
MYLEGVTTRPKLDQKELEDVEHKPYLVWTTVGNFSSREDQDQIEGEPKP